MTLVYVRHKKSKPANTSRKTSDNIIAFPGNDLLNKKMSAKIKMTTTAIFRTFETSTGSKDWFVRIIGTAFEIIL